jgi:hypothetical protein
MPNPGLPSEFVLPDWENNVLTLIEHMFELVGWIATCESKRAFV